MSRRHKNLSFRWVHPVEMLQWFCTIRCWRSTAMTRKSQNQWFYKTMNMVAKNFCGYQNMDSSCHFGANYPKDEKTHAAITIKLFKRLAHIIEQLYEVEIVKAKNEHKEPIIVGFFILQYAKMKNLDLYFTLIKKWDTNKYEELEMNTDYLFLALTVQDFSNCFRKETRMGIVEEQRLWQYIHCRRLP